LLPLFFEIRPNEAAGSPLAHDGKMRLHIEYTAIVVTMTSIRQACVEHNPYRFDPYTHQDIYRLPDEKLIAQCRAAPSYHIPGSKRYGTRDAYWA
jgi:hypothetical protein